MVSSEVSLERGGIEFLLLGKLREQSMWFQCDECIHFTMSGSYL